MRIDADVITLTQWLSPSFPIGAFAYSHGIEAAVARNWVRDGKDLEGWLRDILHLGSGRTDVIWLRLAHECAGPEALEKLNAEALAYAPALSRRSEMERQGSAFATTVRDVWGMNLPDLVLPVAIGAACQHRKIDIELAIPLYLQTFLSNLVAAAQRLMPLGQTEGQRILAALQADCLQLIESTRHATIDDLCNAAFLSDIAAMQHDQLEPRLFQS
jgi:urease accessory protein